MRRLLALTTVALMTMILGGCGMSAEASRLDDYKRESEQILADVIARFPPEVEDGGGNGYVRSEPMYETVNGRGDSPSDPVHWEVIDDWNLPPRPGISRETAEVVIAHLESEGWERTDQETQADGHAIIDSFAKPSDVEGDSWFLRLTHTIPGGTPSEILQILVTSPTTTRGATPPPSSP